MHSGGLNPPGATGGTAEAVGNANVQGNQHCHRNKNHRAEHETKFEGKCQELKGSVYDMVSGNDRFMKTTRDISKYVGNEFDDAGEFQNGMVELQLCPLDA
jgi:hypothetical protein